MTTIAKRPEPTATVLVADLVLLAERLERFDIDAAKCWTYSAIKQSQHDNFGPGEFCGDVACNRCIGKAATGLFGGRK